MKSVFLIFIILALFTNSLFAESSYEREREEVKQLLADDFAALKRGDRTLPEIGEKVSALAATEESDTKKRMLLEGAIRLFQRGGATNRADAVRRELNAFLYPFVQSESNAVLRVGKFGEIEFAKCPQGAVDLVVNWKTQKTFRVEIKRPFWIMKYPLTRMESAFYPPLNPLPGSLSEEALANYVNLNRSQTDGLIKYFTTRLERALPQGYEIRLPTLAEWEYAYHAGTKDVKNPFYDLTSITMEGEAGLTIRYDYDRNEPRRKKRANDWGIGDWCGQEKVCDTFDPSLVVKSNIENPDFYLIESLPPWASFDGVRFKYDGNNRVTIIRMPFWARWKAASVNYGDDWCPVRLVIAPKIK